MSHVGPVEPCCLLLSGCLSRPVLPGSSQPSEVLPENTGITGLSQTCLHISITLYILKILSLFRAELSPLTYTYVEALTLSTSECKCIGR